MHRSLTVLAVAALSFTALNALLRKQRLGASAPAARKSLARWEGEGSGLRGLSHDTPGQTVDSRASAGPLDDVSRFKE